MKKRQRNKLTDTQYAVAREGATEAPFSGIYNDEKSPSYGVSNIN